MLSWQDRAKRRMRKLKINQETLAPKLGLKTRGDVSLRLSGRRRVTPKQFAALAKALNMTTDELLSGTTLDD